MTNDMPPSHTIPRNAVCLWFDGTALDAATFYAETFPDSAVKAVHHAPGDYPSRRFPACRDSAPAIRRSACPRRRA